MSKQKYPQTTGSNITSTGELKQRDYTKTGKLAKRKEQRRLEAIARQVQRVQDYETQLETKGSPKDTKEKYLDARLSLQKIRGGKPEKILVEQFRGGAEEVPK